MAPETFPALSCPSLEEIAAFIEGKLDDADRDRLTAHLATCEDCLELVAETSLFLQDSSPEQEDAACQPVDMSEPRRPPPPGPALAPFSRRKAPGRSSRRSFKIFLSVAAASVLMATSLGLYWQLFAPTSFASVYRPLRQADLARVAPRQWQPRTLRSLSFADLKNLERSFRAGVRMVDLQAGLEAGDREAALESTRDLLKAIASAKLVNPERRVFYDNLEGKLEGPLAPGEDLSVEAREALRKARDLKPVFDERFLLFGQWTEAGRLAAAVGESEFFEVRRNRRFLDEIQQEKRLDPDVQIQLDQVETIWDSSPRSAEDFRRLEQLLTRIIDLSAGR